MKKTLVILSLSLLLAVVCMGCGSKNEDGVNTSEAVAESTVITDPTTSETTSKPLSQEDLIASLPYTPGKMGYYVMADPEIDVGEEVLDSISFDATDGEVQLTRYKVSNSQHDLIKNGKQIGGFIIIDIPQEMLDAAADSFDGFKALAEYVGKKVLPDVYPGKAIIGGGGHIVGGSRNSFVAITYQMGEGKEKAQQWHRIYVGENYCYDFWQDQSWFSDGGTAIMKSLSAEDIKMERNRDAVFHWTVEEVQERGEFVF